jgi:exosortase H (IPTLxxWG-CTERM-specific)
MAKNPAKKETQSQQAAAPGAASTGAAARPAPWLEAKRRVIRFVLVFSALMIAFYALWVAPFVRNDLFPHYLHWNAAAGAALIRLFGHPVQVRGQFIDSLESTHFSLEVGRGCDAIQPTVLFLAAMVALPSTRRAKVLGGLAGTGILLLLNLVRIVTLFFVGLEMPDLFHMMHVDVWQTFFIFIAVLLWMIWALWAMRVPVGRADGPRTP